MELLYLEHIQNVLKTNEKQEIYIENEYEGKYNGCYALKLI